MDGLGNKQSNGDVYIDMRGHSIFVICRLEKKKLSGCRGTGLTITLSVN